MEVFIERSRRMEVSLQSNNIKKIVSVSLGSRERDSESEICLKGQRFILERRGTDGDLKMAKELLEKLDGQVAALGLGGTDLYIYAGGRKYTFRESKKLIENIKQTPVLDGSGLKDSLERIVINGLQKKGVINFVNRKVLLVCGVDRFGMAEALIENEADVTFGDLMFGLGLECPIKSPKTLERLARILAPIITLLPVKWFYPMGERQQKREPKFAKYFFENDIIAGDFHFIRRFMPEKIGGKTVITNTVTAEDRQLLKDAGVRCLVTTTPCLNGRSYGTNVLEGLLVTLSGKKERLTLKEYEKLIEEYEVEPGLEYLNKEEG